ncbi:MAG: pyruvate kinase [Chloroflexi bacterium]|nr:pyruvate kinase [Chloroflexota bacterium]MCI0869090.1 pyruvate kinase [Chloroflexota bacterium]
MKSRLSIDRTPKTKIVCTLGPASESEHMIEELILSGMTVARLNFSHGDIEAHTTAFHRIRHVSAKLGIPVGIMVDVPGPKYRTGPTIPGVLDVKSGDHVTLTSRDLTGDNQLISVAPPGIHRDATVGRPILIDDGLLEFLVTEIEGEDVKCEIVIGGRITERRGVTTPGKSPSQPFPDALAKKALNFARDFGADFVALSTVTKPEDVDRAREILETNGPRGYIISKIERAEALEHLDGIIEVSDAIMVARGDMGVEVPLSRVPIIQKDLINRCNLAGKPVITATQMLESMIRSAVPTRAEVTDVANAIFDGTDAIMLSGETSVGQFPVEAVKVMAQTALEAEGALPYESIIFEKGRQTDSASVADAISYDAVRTAFQIDASLIITFTEAGGSAGRVSKYRPLPKILALTAGEEVQRRLTLRWGVIAIPVTDVENVEDFFAAGASYGKKVGGLSSGDTVVLVAGVPIGVSGSTNLLRVMTIP